MAQLLMAGILAEITADNNGRVQKTTSEYTVINVSFFRKQKIVGIFPYKSVYSTLIGKHQLLRKLYHANTQWLTFHSLTLEGTQKKKKELTCGISRDFIQA